jgi:putative DNA methylase
MSGTPIPGAYVQAEGKAGRIGARLMAIVAESERGRIYLPPNEEHEAAAQRATPGWKPDVEFLQQALGFRVGNYGMTKWSDLLTNRQVAALTTLSQLVQEARDRAREHATERTLADADAYGDAIAVYLGLAVGRVSDYCSTICTWAGVDWQGRGPPASQWPRQCYSA